MGTWLFVLTIVSLAVPLAYLLARSLQREETARRRAAAALENRERHYRAKYRVARVLTESSARGPALASFLTAIGEELGWSLGTVSLRDEEDGGLRRRAVWTAPDGSGVAARQTARPLRVPITSGDRDYGEMEFFGIEATRTTTRCSRRWPRWAWSSRSSSIAPAPRRSSARAASGWRASSTTARR